MAPVRGIDHRYGEATGGLATALSQAQTLDAAATGHASARRADLAERADTLRSLVTALQKDQAMVSPALGAPSCSR